LKNLRVNQNIQNTLDPNIENIQQQQQQQQFDEVVLLRGDLDLDSFYKLIDGEIISNAGNEGDIKYTFLEMYKAGPAGTATSMISRFMREYLAYAYTFKDRLNIDVKDLDMNLRLSQVVELFTQRAFTVQYKTLNQTLVEYGEYKITANLTSYASSMDIYLDNQIEIIYATHETIDSILSVFDINRIEEWVGGPFMVIYHKDDHLMYYQYLAAFKYIEPRHIISTEKGKFHYFAASMHSLFYVMDAYANELFKATKLMFSYITEFGIFVLYNQRAGFQITDQEEKESHYRAFVIHQLTVVKIKTALDDRILSLGIFKNRYMEEPNNKLIFDNSKIIAHKGGSLNVMLNLIYDIFQEYNTPENFHITDEKSKEILHSDYVANQSNQFITDIAIPTRVLKTEDINEIKLKFNWWGN